MSSVGGRKFTGFVPVLEGDQTWEAAVIHRVVPDARLSRRSSRLWDASGFVTPFHINSLLYLDLLACQVVRDQDAGDLIGIVLFMMQCTSGATSPERASTLQEDGRFVAGVDASAAEITLFVRHYKATISDVAPSPYDSQKQESNQYILDFHWLTPLAIGLTSPYHFQIA